MTGSEPLVGRCYTRARRLPLMIGRLPGSQGALWGGPYTMQQFVVACLTLLGMWLTHPVWARFGGLVNAVILLAVPMVAAFAVRRARIEGRTPVRAAAGLLAFYTFPACGRIAGRPCRNRGPVAFQKGRFWVQDRPEPEEVPG